MSTDPHKVPPDLSQFHFVDRAPRNIRGQMLRDPAGVRVRRSGVCDVNVAGTELFDAIAAALGFKPDQYAIRFGGNAETMQVVAQVVSGKTPGAAPVRRYTPKGSMSIYMTELFRDLPDLRPPAARWCVMHEARDKEDKPYVLISLGLGLERRVVRRRKKASTNPDSAAAGTQPAAEDP